MRNDAYLKPKNSVLCMCRGACTCKLRKAQADSKSAATVVANFEAVHGKLET